MKNLLQEIERLEKEYTSLIPSEAKRNEWLHKVNAFSSKFLSQTDTTSGYNSSKPNFTFTISDGPIDIEKILNEYEKNVSSLGIQAASAAHLGYIPGGGIYAAALGDYLAAITNEYAGMKFASPGAVAIENSVLDWLKELFHFPEDSVGNLTSGGSIANLIALTSARDHHNISGDKIQKSVIYVSQHVHHCNHKALRIIGLGDVIIRELKLDDNFRIETTELHNQIDHDLKMGLLPFMIIASAGTTDTGAVDPLEKIGRIAKEYQMWFHIDAAYGGFFYLVDAYKHLFRGIQMADSLVVDPHKGLFLPYGVGAVLIKHKNSVLQSHHYTANYMQDANQDHLDLNPADLSPELSKHFRGLRVWLPLQLHGIAVFKSCLEEKLLLTLYARQKLRELSYELGPAPDLSVTFFWHKKGDDFTRKLMQLIHDDGDVFLSSSNIGGRFVIRVAILAFRTKKATIDRMILMIKRCESALV